MSHQTKVIAVSLGLLGLLAVVAAAIIYSGPPDAYAPIGFGLIMLAGSIVEALILLVIAIVIRVRKLDGGITTTRPAAEVLDATEQRVPLGYRERAKAYFLAMTIVLIVGGSACYGALVL